MAHNYIVLQTNNYTAGPPETGLRKQFQAVAMRHFDHKAQHITETAGGGLDATFGGIYTTLKYALRCYNDLESPLGLTWGTRQDVLYFYSLNNPNGTPGSALRLQDHYEEWHDVLFVGDVVPEPLTTIVVGQYALYVIPVEFRIIPT
jgi:hypothetical protein